MKERPSETPAPRIGKGSPAAAGLTRRQALGHLGVTAALGLAPPRRLFGEAPSATPFVNEAGTLLRHHPAFDLHSHPGLFMLKGLPESGYAGDETVLATVRDMITGHLAGTFFSLVADAKILERGPDGVRPARRFEPGEAWSEYRRQISVLHELLARLPCLEARRTSDIEQAPHRGTVAALVACEGGDCLEGRVERLERLYSDGVRSLQLVHYAPNDVGDLQTAPAQHGGLSRIGVEVVRTMNQLGMLIDVAHASFETVARVAEVTEQPIMLSHSHLQTVGREHPRLITAEHARLVASTGGVIGVWPSGFANETFQDFVDNTLRLAETIGLDYVALGSDMDGNYRPVMSSYRQLPDWVAGLLAKGLSHSEVAQLAGGNALRVLRRVIG